MGDAGDARQRVRRAAPRSDMTQRSMHGRAAVFPLNLVLFPGGLLPLRIFEPRYLRMVSECLRGNACFAVTSIVAGVEAGGGALCASEATLARIIDWEQRDDGLLGILCEGERRCSLGRIDTESDGLLRAEVMLHPVTTPLPVPEDLAWALDLLNSVFDTVGAPFDRLRGAQTHADDVAARLIELLPLPLHEKQALFEISGDGPLQLRRLAGLIMARRPTGGDSGLC